MDFDRIKWNEQGLVPAIAQDVDTGEVLMMAWMNRQSLEMTLDSGEAVYFSRSRQEIWKKGATSGNIQKVIGIWLDCDGDTVLLKVRPAGPACHTGAQTCFYTAIQPQKEFSRGAGVLADVRRVVEDRLEHPVEGSYTNYLFEKGIDKICKKVGEEAAEVIIAAKNRSHDEVQYEVADLLYHLTVLLVEQGVPTQDVFEELASRHTGRG
nr:bifunctional phosphoribosyl-AMP cyclohydrolase/phosphoribosyl-ATP diphosphatase HisIE [bacterium]